MPNNLAGETSPYLLQHKDNPVEWYPWGPKALEKARAEDKPIFLSIGYSACHWCHVMEHESFESQETAELMNALYINIKVDREERPDLDNIYMQAVQAMTGHGGWPMSVFLTPDGRPFYGGTYFPPEERHGMPSFQRILMAVADAYQNKRGELHDTANALIARMIPPVRGQEEEDLTLKFLHATGERIRENFDKVNGGFGSAPKFPQPMSLDYLLRVAHRSKDSDALRMVELTLEKMARGGIYDQVGGGFHRYSTDAQWLVPHFEKMLYDNALLSRTYLHAYQFTGNHFFKRITEETLDYVLWEMTDVNGAFHSTQDADSEGVEGKFFVWTPQEVVEILGSTEGALFNNFFGVTDVGNFEGQNILNIPVDQSTFAKQHGLDESELSNRIRISRKALYKARDQRVHPGRDEKTLTSWNGMMLRSLAEAAAVLGRSDYLEAAERNADFLLKNLRKDGLLLRTCKDGQAKLPGFLEDYAMLTDGLIAVYEATFAHRWIKEARALADLMIKLFWDETEGIFYDTGASHETLVVRPRDIFDNASPCGGSTAADVLLRLGSLTGQVEYSRKAASSLRSVSQYMSRAPSGFAHWLGALDFHLASSCEIVLIGGKEDPSTQAMRSVVFGSFMPNKVVAGLDPAEPKDALDDISLLVNREQVNGLPTAYVCENYACLVPATDPETLSSQLELRK